MEALYRRFQSKGLVILAISDEDASKVQPFIAAAKCSYPILLDPGRKVNEQFVVEGIPKSFLYDRNGKLVAKKPSIAAPNNNSSPCSNKPACR